MRILTADEAAIEAKLRADLRWVEGQLKRAQKTLARVERRVELRRAELERFIAKGIFPRRKGVRKVLEDHALADVLTRAQQQGRVQRQRGRS